MVITLNLQKTFFVHSVLIVQDLLNGKLPENQTDTNKWLQNLDIYIGNDPDMKKNKKCPGGPFMVVEDLIGSYS